MRAPSAESVLTRADWVAHVVSMRISYVMIQGRSPSTAHVQPVTRQPSACSRKYHTSKPHRTPRWVQAADSGGEAKATTSLWQGRGRRPMAGGVKPRPRPGARRPRRREARLVHVDEAINARHPHPEDRDDRRRRTGATRGHVCFLVTAGATCTPPMTDAGVNLGAEDTSPHARPSGWRMCGCACAIPCRSRARPPASRCPPW